MYLFILS